MDKEYPEYKYLYLEIIRTLSNIKNFIEKLEAHEYYSKNSGIFLVIINQFIDILQNKLAPQNSDDKIPLSQLNNVLSDLNYNFIPILRYIRRSQTKDIPWSLVPHIEEFIYNLLGENYIILIRPQWHWNYSVILGDVSSFLKSFIERYTGEKNLLKIEKELHVISFPVLEKTNFLLHTMFGHEIGHFFQQVYFKDILQKEWKRKKVLDVLSASFRKNINPYRQFADSTRAVIIYKEILVKEILPDIIGYLLLGPSILFALYYHSFWNKDDFNPKELTNIDINQDSYDFLPHPPLKYRIRILFKEFFEKDINNITSGIAKVTLEDIYTKIQSYLDDKSDLDLFKSNPLSENAFNIFEESISEIEEFCINKLGEIKYEFNIKTINCLVEKIKNKIPPNELGNKPVKLGDIFLSGWIYYYDLLKEKETFKKDEYIKLHVRLDRLLLKASNSIYIHSYYWDHKKWPY
ncbi:MAG: hypothetical protein H8E13_22285 [Actinobacteria bacterium]|nr:hypothetical protein [Actinomycetota bacterium]